MDSLFLEAIREITGPDQCKTKEPMKNHITFRVGGEADYYIQPSLSQIPEVIGACRDHQIPFLVIGNGSNLLAGDRGIRGAVIEIGKNAAAVRVSGSTITAEAGAMLASVARAAAEHGLAGMEFASGIPGTIGGAVVMNAGAYGGEMKQLIQSVTVLTEKGGRKQLSLEELDLGYRRSCILSKGYTVLEAELKLEPGNPQAIQEQMARLREQRMAKQPLEYPSAGSTFKRPEGYFAGKLIQDAGLLGFQVGGAQVSEKHGGFVVNKGNATAADIRRLMEEVQDRVEEKFKVRLEPEVKFIGEF